MDLSDDQHDAEVKRTIALYVGGFGSIIWGAVFLLLMSFLIERDNRIKIKKKAEDLRRESALIKKRQEEQQLEDKSKVAQKISESSDSEDGESPTISSSADQKVDPSLNGFFRRSSIVAVISPLNGSQSSDGESGTHHVPEIYEPIEIPRSDKGETSNFKENLTTALQLHMQTQNSGPSSRRAFEGIANLGLDSNDSSISNSRRTSAVDSPAYPHGSCISSQEHSRRASTVQDPIRPLPEYESLKFVPGVTGATEDSNELPRYGIVIARSRRGSMDNQYGQGSSKTESSTDPDQNDFLPVILESPPSTLNRL